MSVQNVAWSSARGRTALGVIGAITALGAWFVLSAQSNTAYFPALSAILADAAEYWTTRDGLANINASLTTLSVGLAIAVVVGVAAGLLIGQLPIVERMVSPTLEFARAIPSTALIPFAMMLFGVSPEMKIFLIALGCVWPVLLSTADGARRLDATMVASARAFNISGLRRQVYVVLPAVLPRVLVGMRIAIPLSLILMVTSEMVGAQTGLGFVITQAQATFQLRTMWSGILILGVLGFLMTSLYALAERRLLRWCNPVRTDMR